MFFDNVSYYFKFVFNVHVSVHPKYILVYNSNQTHKFVFNVHVSVHRKYILVYNSNQTHKFVFNVHVSVHRKYILVYNSNQTHKSQTTALHIPGVTITHLQEHKTTVTTASCNYYTVIDRVKFLLLLQCNGYQMIQLQLFCAPEDG